MSVFALTVEDAAAVADVARGYDADDPASRPEADAVRFQPGPCPPRFRFGVPAGAALEFFGDVHATDVFHRTLADLEALGGQRVELDFAPFREAAGLLYDGPFVAERLEAAGALLATNPGAIVDPVRIILEGAARFDARTAFAAQHRLATLRRRAAALLARVDFLVVRRRRRSTRSTRSRRRRCGSTRCWGPTRTSSTCSISRRWRCRSGSAPTVFPPARR